MKDFRYFSHSLLEVNDKFENISFVGGDQDKARKEFLKPLKRYTFLPCRKHVQDDIVQKLSDLGNRAMRDEVLKIFSGVTATRRKELLTAPARMSFSLKLSLSQINGMILRDQSILVRSPNFLLTSEHTLKKT